MLQHQNLFHHISENIVPELIDNGEIDAYLEQRYLKESEMSS
jgi:hypothetical protein